MSVMRTWARVALLLSLTGVCWWTSWSQYQAASSALLNPPPHNSIKSPSSANNHLISAKRMMPRTETHWNTDGSGNSSQIFHFIHISDIHISQFNAHGGLEHLKRFLAQELPLIAPHLVVVTGDLVDAKNRPKHRSAQYEQEWLAYNHLLQSSGLLSSPSSNHSDFWWDQRGNHDCFNAPTFDHPGNFYSRLSATKREGYAYHYKTSSGNTYSFIGPDACPARGMGRPLNFFGVLDAQDMNFLHDNIDPSANHTFLMTHYPSATLLLGRSTGIEPLSLWDLPLSLHLCGHLHTLIWGLGEKMYTRHQHYLELELGDMKNHAMFRIIAIDHDLISFVDLPLALPEIPAPVTDDLNADPFVTLNASFLSTVHLQSRPPIILITNPKDGRYMLGREPIQRIAHSHHIRVLIWSVSNISASTVSIDDKMLPSPLRYAGHGDGSWTDLSIKHTPYTPLWVVEWDPSQLDPSTLHRVRVWAKDADGLESSHEVKFYVDGRLLSDLESGSGGFILSLALDSIFTAIFVIVYFMIMVVCLLVPRLIVEYHGSSYALWRQRSSMRCVELYSNVFHRSETRGFSLSRQMLFRLVPFCSFVLTSCLLRFCELARHSSIFWILYGYGLYVTVGPWFVGRLFITDGIGDGGFLDLPRTLGFFMLHGVWFWDDHTSWIPTIETRFFCMKEIIENFAPLVLYLPFLATPTTLIYPQAQNATKPFHRHWIAQLIISIMVLYRIKQCYMMAVWYGSLATILAPGKTWFLIWAIWILWKWRNGSPLCSRLSSENYIMVNNAHPTQVLQSYSAEGRSSGASTPTAVVSSVTRIAGTPRGPRNRASLMDHDAFSENEMLVEEGNLADVSN